MALICCYPVLLLVVGGIIAFFVFDFIKKKNRKRITDFPRIYKADAVKVCYLPISECGKDLELLFILKIYLSSFV